MTTSTPDQGALERDARALLVAITAYHYDDRLDAAMRFLTAAASEARAAERERCEQIVQNYIDRPTSGPKNNTLSAFEQGMDHMAGCIDNASAIYRAMMDAARVSGPENDTNSTDEVAGPDEQLAHILQSMLDKVDGDPPRDWHDLSEPERGFFKMCIYCLLSETALIEATKPLVEASRQRRNK